MRFELDGTELHYDLHGEGEPLLWLHGGLGHGPDWRYMFGEAPAGYRIIAPDLRGHGRSTGAGETYSFRRSALDMLTLLDRLRVERVNIIGVSGGGITALHMATIEPARISAMVIVSAPAAFPEQARAIQRDYSEATLSEAERGRMRERHPRAGQLEALFRQINAMADGNDPNFTPRELATITADTLIVFGDRDPLYPISLACDLRQSIPRSWLWVIPNGGHGPVFGADAPRFVEIAMPFLGGAYRVR